MFINSKLSTVQRNHVNLESVKDIETNKAIAKNKSNNILNNKLLWVLYLQNYKN